MNVSFHLMSPRRLTEKVSGKSEEFLMESPSITVSDSVSIGTGEAGRRVYVSPKIIKVTVSGNSMARICAQEPLQKFLLKKHRISIGEIGGSGF